EADRAIEAFGGDARARGFQHPEAMVSARELARALGSDRLVVLDVRPHDRFETGHIPSSRDVGRDDYEMKEPIPGLSKSVADLGRVLADRGVFKDSIVVLYGDGGPEPYRFWWTLASVAGYDSRVLDGGLQSWKRAGFVLAAGAARKLAKRGDIALAAPREKPK